ncbi:type II toxin-antitoxin system RelE family toxin [Actinomyces qiguomingii]|uniref:type II toxin-antitoxin system RelE family toxin n=1 Tax=Actinomyces qiguomingii TaxID=2057800 RepID=UPI000CA08755|nr:type II toxin-antitoxin system RelE/ParE family toxin [Actinomyces qiguomingii]
MTRSSSTDRRQPKTTSHTRKRPPHRNPGSNHHTLTPEEPPTRPCKTHRPPSTVGNPTPTPRQCPARLTAYNDPHRAHNRPARRHPPPPTTWPGTTPSTAPEPNNHHKRLTQHDLIQGAIALLATNPHPPGCRPLKGRPAWRVRVGEYRIIYTIDDGRLVVVVVTLGHRRDVYR